MFYYYLTDKSAYNQKLQCRIIMVFSDGPCAPGHRDASTQALSGLFLHMKITFTYSAWIVILMVWSGHPTPGPSVEVAFTRCMLCLSIVMMAGHSGARGRVPGTGGGGAAVWSRADQLAQRGRLLHRAAGTRLLWPGPAGGEASRYPSMCWISINVMPCDVVIYE